MPELFIQKVEPLEKCFVVDIGESFVLDLGAHFVGHFSFKLDIVDDFIDAPTRLNIKFCEDKREIEDDFSLYHGVLSKTWLQEAVIDVDFPKDVSLERRYSCRYIKITVEATNKPVKLFDFVFTASTSADMSRLSFPKTSDALLGEIDRVACLTLKDCMQTFFEDGPKRDRRLWIGDLRLEALTDYYTFNNLELVRRCLYLFASASVNSLGFVPAYVYTEPYFFSGRDAPADYALLYVVSVCDYFENTGDRKTVLDLLDLCRSQLDSFEKILDERLIVTQQEGWFTFIDWCPGLHKLISLQGIYLYALDAFIKLLDALGESDSAKYALLLEKVRNSTKKHLFNKEKGVFINSLDQDQLSVHSQVWMILGGVITGTEAKLALDFALSSPDAKHPFTPYMHHYVIEAMLALGLKDEAVSLLKEHWGGMLKNGADTFYEVYSENDPDFSPYGDRMINSLCHAWSCTPAYFIRKYGL